MEADHTLRENPLIISKLPRTSMGAEIQQNWMPIEWLGELELTGQVQLDIAMEIFKILRRWFHQWKFETEIYGFLENIWEWII